MVLPGSVDRVARIHAYGRLAALAAVLLVALVAGQLLGAGSAAASITSDAQAAADIATSAGYRTGVAVLDLKTGQYVGAGDDTGSFASESVAKVLIATELLATGQMTGSTETTAYQMITESDDDDADALYGLAGGDDVINLVAQRYNIPFLGTAPSEPGWWGNTEINAKGMVYLYAAIAKDPVVGPWLMDAMAHATEYGADGTYQFFGIASATTGAAIKQGWGDDGDDSPNAVFNSTGYVDDDQFAVAILTDGSPSTYGATISDMVTSQAQTLMPGGQLDNPADHNPVLGALVASATGSTVQVSGTATDPDTSAPLTVTISEGATQVATATTDATGAFRASFPAADGRHSYTASVANVGEGTAGASAAAAALTVNGNPIGDVTSVLGGAGEVTIVGTESDPNAKTARLTVSIDGKSVVEDVAGSYDLVIPAPAGSADVSVEYDHSSAAENVAVGSWDVTVARTAAQQRRTEDVDRLLVAAVAIAPVVLLALTMLIRRRRFG